MEKGLVSVIIPTYQRNEQLKRAVHSVINQTYDNIEIIIINDSPSTKMPREIENSTSVTIYKNDNNIGAPRSRNRGINLAKGEFVAFLDDDDYWLPEKLKKQVSVFKDNPDVGLVYSGRKIIKDNGGQETDYPVLEGYVYGDLLHHNEIPSETPLIRMNCLSKDVQFDPDLESCQDWDLWLKISKRYPIAHVNEILAVCDKQNTDRIGKDPEKTLNGHKRLLIKYWKDFIREPLGLVYILYVIVFHTIQVWLLKYRDV